MKGKHDPLIIFMTLLISVFTLMLIVNVSQSLPGQKPDYVTFNPSTERAYMFAKKQPENASYFFPCYCGCGYMVHADEILQHESLKECFFKPDGSYEIPWSELRIMLHHSQQCRRYA